VRAIKNTHRCQNYWCCRFSSHLSSGRTAYGQRRYTHSIMDKLSLLKLLNKTKAFAISITTVFIGLVLIIIPTFITTSNLFSEISLRLGTIFLPSGLIGFIYHIYLRKTVREEIKTELEDILLQKLYKSKFDDAFLELRQGILILETELDKRKILPKVLITINRNGAIAAGILSIRMKIEEVICIPRKKKQKINDSGIREFEVGRGVKLDSAKINHKECLIVSMLIDSGVSLESGLAYLESMGIKGDIPIATVYVSHSALYKRENIIYAYKVQDGNQILNKQPWIVGERHIV